MNLIYVAGPYTSDKSHIVDLNMLKAKHASIDLWRLGWAVITPHLNSGRFEAYKDLTYEMFANGTMEMMERCDAVFMLNDWKESKGAKAELVRASQLNIPIFYEKDGYPTIEDYINVKNSKI